MTPGAQINPAIKIRSWSCRVAAGPVSIVASYLQLRTSCLPVLSPVCAGMGQEKDVSGKVKNPKQAQWRKPPIFSSDRKKKPSVIEDLALSTISLDPEEETRRRQEAMKMEVVSTMKGEVAMRLNPAARIKSFLVPKSRLFTRAALGIPASTCSQDRVGETTRETGST